MCRQATVARAVNSHRDPAKASPTCRHRRSRLSSGVQTSSILDPNLPPTLIARLAAFAARFAAPTAVLGTLLIPTPNSGGVTEGTLPGTDGVRFRHDGPAGLLALAYKLTDGSEVRVRAESRHGLFIDPKTATAIGRDLGEQLALDLAALHLVLAAALQAEHKERPKPWAAIDEDEPKLCPAPVKEVDRKPKSWTLDYEPPRQPACTYSKRLRCCDS